MTTVARSESIISPRQNWILNAGGDWFWIIGTPILALAWALLTLVTLGPIWVISIFVVFNASHHMPTFLRIYGDKDLFARFRWSLLLGPILPFCFAMAVVAFLVSSGRSLNDFLFLGLITAIWDPWHFLMQHYGFMRIYDRHNHAPRSIAARMDLALCGSWFVYLMLAALEWLPSLMYELVNLCGIWIPGLIDISLFAVLHDIALVVALGVTLGYLYYLTWCRRHGYFISHAKLALMLVTFGVMYLTYIPNGMMKGIISGLQQWNPAISEWSFPLGFATIGMVHVTQYMAIVWKYNRSLASRPGASRPGWFLSSFTRGGLVIILLYVIFCQFYGFLVTWGPADVLHPGWLLNQDAVAVKWVAGTLAAVLFTSTIMHYYYDGFIWKIRHKENRQNLACVIVEPVQRVVFSEPGFLSGLRKICDDNDVVEPLEAWTPTVGISGLDYYGSDRIPGGNGSLLVTSLRGAELWRIQLSEDGRSVVSTDVIYRGDYGRLRDVLVSPDGEVYIATSNEDGRGQPASDDDRILKITRRGVS